MALGICTNSIRKNGPGCDHRAVSITLAGEALVWEGMEAELDAMPWGAEQKQTLMRHLLKFSRVNENIALENLIGRVVLGMEATNVKQYDFLAPGMAITKTNIGTAYVNVCPGANGERVLVDCTGCTQFRVVLTANLVGTGAFGARVVRDSDNTVLFENANIALTGERELDTDWQSLPVWATGLEILRLQAKSATASDDPVFRRCVMLVR